MGCSSLWSARGGVRVEHLAASPLGHPHRTDGANTTWGCFRAKRLGADAVRGVKREVCEQPRYAAHPTWPLLDGRAWTYADAALHGTPLRQVLRALNRALNNWQRLTP